MWLALAIAGIASMTAAFERGDVDEAAREGANAGTAVVRFIHANANTNRNCFYRARSVP